MGFTVATFHSSGTSPMMMAWLIMWVISWCIINIASFRILEFRFSIPDDLYTDILLTLFEHFLIVYCVEVHIGRVLGNFIVLVSMGYIRQGTCQLGANLGEEVVDMFW